MNKVTRTMNSNKNNEHRINNRYTQINTDIHKTHTTRVHVECVLLVHDSAGYVGGKLSEEHAASICRVFIIMFVKTSV
jgi:urease accessory protein UreH